MTVALVTRAADGLGLAISRELADLDVEVVLTAADEAQARAAAERLWEEGLDTVHPRALDPSSEQSVLRLRELLEEEFGALHALVLVGDDGAERVREALAHLLGRDGAGRVLVATAGDDAAAVARRAVA